MDHDCDCHQMYTLFGGDGAHYMFELPAQYRSTEAAAAEWAARLTDERWPNWGDGQEPHQYVIRRDDCCGDLPDHWTREEVEALAAVHHARTELTTLMANFGRSFGAVGVEEARDSNAGMRGFVLFVMLDQLAEALLEVSRVHAGILDPS